MPEEANVTNSSCTWSAVNGSDSVDGNNNMTSRNASQLPTGVASGQALGYTYTVLAGLSFVVFLYCTNKGLKEVHPCVVATWVGICGLVLALIGMLVFETPMFPSDTACQLLYDCCLGMLYVQEAR